MKWKQTAAASVKRKGVGEMNTYGNIISNRKIMEESRMNSIIYRLGAWLIVSSLFMTAVSANKQISKYRFTFTTIYGLVDWTRRRAPNTIFILTIHAGIHGHFNCVF